MRYLKNGSAQRFRTFASEARTAHFKKSQATPCVSPPSLLAPTISSNACAGFSIASGSRLPEFLSRRSRDSPKTLAVVSLLTSTTTCAPRPFHRISFNSSCSVPSRVTDWKIGCGCLVFAWKKSRDSNSLSIPCVRRFSTLRLWKGGLLFPGSRRQPVRCRRSHRLANCFVRQRCGGWIPFPDFQAANFTTPSSDSKTPSPSRIYFPAAWCG